MKKLALLLILSITSFLLIGQDSTQEKVDDLEKEWEKAMEKASEAIKDFEIPEIDFEKVAKEIEKNLPTKEEVEKIKVKIEDGIEKAKEVDLSKVGDILADLEESIKDIEGIFKEKAEENKDVRKEKSQEKKQ